MKLLPRYSFFSLFNRVTADISEIGLSESHSDVRLFSPASGEMSEMSFPQRYSFFRLVSHVTAEMSDMELLPRLSSVRLFNLVSGEISEILLPQRNRPVRLVAFSSAVKSLMLAFGASSSVKFTISTVVIVVSGALPRAFSTAARRFASGMVTGAASANATVTPLSWRVGMYVWNDASFRRFPLTSIVSPLPNPILVISGARFEMLLL